MTISEAKKEAVDSGFLAFVGNSVGKVISFPVGIVVASILGPSGYGLLAIVGVLRNYINYLHLGALSNITREVPIAYGRGDVEDARRIYGVVATNYLTTTVLGLVILWGLYSGGVFMPEELKPVHMAVLTVVVLTAAADSFFYTMVKGEGAFILFGKYEVVSKILVPPVTLALVYFFGFTGMLWSYVFTHVLGFTFVSTQLSWPSFRLRYDWEKTRVLLRTSIMMHLNKIIDGVFISIGVIVAAQYLSTADVGVLGFAMALASIKKVPFARIFAVTVSRKMAVQAGQTGIEKHESFARYFGTTYVVYLLLLSAILGVMVLLYSIVVEMYVQEFQASVPLLFVLYFALGFYNARYFAYVYIDATRQMNKRTAILGIGVIVNLVLCYGLVQMGYGVLGIAVAVAVSMIVVSVHTIVFTLNQVFPRRRHAFVFLGKLLFISSALTGILVLYNDTSLVSHGDLREVVDVMRAGLDFGLKAVTFCSVSYLLHVFLFRKEKVHEEVVRLVRYLPERFLPRSGRVAGQAAR